MFRILMIGMILVSLAGIVDYVGRNAGLEKAVIPVVVCGAILIIVAAIVGFRLPKRKKRWVQLEVVQAGTIGKNGVPYFPQISR